MTPDPDPERLAALEARIAAMKGKAGVKRPKKVSGFSQGEMAWRMVIELVTGMLLGMAIGYGLDWLTGTQPIFLVIFAMLGFAAGVKTMLGTAKQMATQEAASAATAQMAAKADMKNTAAKAAGDEGE
ncbi:AtpZ/AtpI family protein [Rhodobacter sp. KR11]|uniref:AtpZ/AtpI family protein n=1 Tax=Rhodobacter sp. KR11 TaxID=2974588 RepID=UPI002222DD7D|nr:AtpZ/AtpI family protein [Rhodobacter sp. KR11]MCW1918254.1 AtpZ/AtpI family protein [Rhodobacter sp. KR11]